jgi:hypothetical protein
MTIENKQPVGKEGSILGMVYKSETVIAAEERGDSVVEQARFNEAIRVIEGLEAEVLAMEMPARFSRTKKPSESLFNTGVSSEEFVDLSEDEYKRKTLLLELRKLKSQIAHAVGQLKGVVMDIEATKQE